MNHLEITLSVPLALAGCAVNPEGRQTPRDVEIQPAGGVEHKVQGTLSLPEVMIRRTQFAIKYEAPTAEWTQESRAVHGNIYSIGEQIINVDKRVCGSSEADDKMAFLGCVVSESLPANLRERMMKYDSMVIDLTTRALAPSYAVFANFTTGGFSIVMPD